MSSNIDPADFTTTIDNPYYTLRAGTTFIVEDKGANSTATIVVTHETKVVDGVTCVEVRDTGTINGVVFEDTFDWFAQDKAGNVWYFGEATQEFEPGNLTPNPEGSWEAGVNGATPGIVMEADPQRGDVYRQEHAAGVAEDTARILNLNANVDTIYGSSASALKTLEFSPLEPGATEQKYYVAGVGFVLALGSEGAHEQLARILVDGGAGDDVLVGYAGGDIMSGLAGADLMRGLGGNDTMTGGTGSDTLSGGNGGDVLIGGAGNDWLIGGGGADRFIFTGLVNGAVETDTLTGYREGDVDVIDLVHGFRSIASQAIIHGEWHLTLKGDGDIIILTDAVDANHNGRIVDDLLLV